MASSPTAEVPTEAAPPQQELEGRTLAEAPRHEPSNWSIWRYPSQPGKLPGYVRAQFRMKIFALIGMQCLVVFLLTLLLDLAMGWMDTHFIKVTTLSVSITSIATVTSLVVLHSVRTTYPANYLALLAFTLLVSCSWSSGGHIGNTHVHFLILGVITVAMCVATALQALTLHLDVGECRAVAWPLFLGWLLGGCLALLAAATHTVKSTDVVLAMGVSSFQFTWLVLDMNMALQKCDPDDFMKVVVSMDSTLLVVVSIPFWILGACCVHIDQNTWAQQDEANPERNANGQEQA